MSRVAYSSGTVSPASGAELRHARTLRTARAARVDLGQWRRATWAEATRKDSLSGLARFDGNRIVSDDIGKA
jgi:hypothetical protein